MSHNGHERTHGGMMQVSTYFDIKELTRYGNSIRITPLIVGRYEIHVYNFNKDTTYFTYFTSVDALAPMIFELWEPMRIGE